MLRVPVAARRRLSTCPALWCWLGGEYGGEWSWLVETDATAVHCVQCGGRDQVNDRREHLLRDVCQSPAGRRC
jgi:hypothetical protein